MKERCFRLQLDTSRAIGEKASILVATLVTERQTDRLWFPKRVLPPAGYRNYRDTSV